MAIFRPPLLRLSYGQGMDTRTTTKKFKASFEDNATLRERGLFALLVAPQEDGPRRGACVLSRNSLKSNRFTRRRAALPKKSHASTNRRMFVQETSKILSIRSGIGQDNEFLLIFR